jgi:polyhydroxybutyrate depolymerase
MIAGLVWFLLLAFAGGETVEWSLNVDGLTRSARVYLPNNAAAKKPTTGAATLSSTAESSASNGIPVVFGFHGHGGNSRNAQRTFQIEQHWPEAIVVYMQGIPTPGQLTDPDGKKNGWQSAEGAQNDRDLKFFDAMMVKLEAEYSIDKERVYATGHSNGGGFSYLLWAARGDKFAAFAPCASAAGRRIKLTSPKPVLHLAGKNDPLVKFAWQTATIELLIELNDCAKTSQSDAKVPWAVYPSSEAPVYTYIHEGTHKYPDEAPAIIAKFFREQPWKR